MLDIHFEINGKQTSSNNIADALERAMVEAIADELRTQLASVRDPSTGEFPTVVARGNSVDNLSVEVEGSDAIVALAKARLADEFDVEEQASSDQTIDKTPNVFLCHGSEDKPLVEQLATDLRTNGIEVFYDEWCIAPGDSIRQRIDEGLSECTHFVVLLTETSLVKKWVNAEIDAGFVQKLDGQCRFVPLRYRLEASALPPLLAALHAPSIDDYDRDLRALIGFLFGISEKPPLSNPPELVRDAHDAVGVSPGAKRIVDLMMAGTKHALHMDPQVSAEEMRESSGLTDDEIIDAVFELEGRGLLKSHVSANAGTLGFVRIVPEAALFVEFDAHYNNWDPKQDGLRVAAELLNQEEDASRPPDLADRFGWDARRMNPATTYLIERHLVRHSDAVGTGAWCTAWIRRTDATRRFVSSRS